MRHRSTGRDAVLRSFRLVHRNAGFTHSDVDGTAHKCGEYRGKHHTRVRLRPENRRSGRRHLSGPMARRPVRTGHSHKTLQNPATRFQNGVRARPACRFFPYKYRHILSHGVPCGGNPLVYPRRSKPKRRHTCGKRPAIATIYAFLVFYRRIRICRRSLGGKVPRTRLADFPAHPCKRANAYRAIFRDNFHGLVHLRRRMVYGNACRRQKRGIDSCRLSSMGCRCAFMRLRCIYF